MIHRVRMSNVRVVWVVNWGATATVFRGTGDEEAKDTIEDDTTMEAWFVMRRKEIEQKWKRPGI